MAPKQERSGKVHLAWSEATEKSARRLAAARRQELHQVFAAAIELAEIRYEAEQAALALHYAGKQRRTG